VNQKSMGHRLRSAKHKDATDFWQLSQNSQGTQSFESSSYFRLLAL
jgi:hypothetical protein